MTDESRPLSVIVGKLFADFEIDHDRTRLKRRLGMTALNFRRAKKFFEANNSEMLMDIFIPKKKRS